MSLIMTAWVKMNLPDSFSWFAFLFVVILLVAKVAKINTCLVRFGFNIALAMSRLMFR